MKFLERQDNGTRQVVFIDELPWMDSPRSDFMTALESFWNGWGCSRHNRCLVVCGSATSWMLDKLINNKGGLYGRLTGEVKLYPFTIKECEDFSISRGIKMSRYNVAQAYMILGGIPYYLNYFTPSLSLAQNNDALFFSKRAKLANEFERLFVSIFDNAGACMKVVRMLAHRHSGYTRDEIASKTGINPNGDFSKVLKALELSDFITRYIPFGESRRKEHYKLSDCFCWFWLYFKEKKIINETDFWQRHLRESNIPSWRGIAFEEVCLQHVGQIKTALQVAGVSSNESSLIVKGDDLQEGMQIDLIIDRADDVMNVCEMKYCKNSFTVTKGYAEKIKARQTFLETSMPNKTIIMTLLSNSSATRNEYSDAFVIKLTIDDLFSY